MEWMLMPYRRYADFSGRSRRKEYWMFFLFLLIVYLVCFGIMMAGGFSMSRIEGGQASPGPVFWLGAILLVVVVLGSIIPSIAVQVRRFHDQDRSGWMVLINFIPYIGGLIVLVFMFLEGTRGPNRFGPDPKDPNSAQAFT